ncbi:MAG TPA: response regulator [Accumulibacter sp.]|nr:response regulator [Accumulibacter sp.]HMW16928.1 response regulator [Accumulibacter sp.]HMX21455.1 response regulator [Accumulibacter sp.]HNC17395.1 response regulator [Accumulibacter sp.]HND78847.1 response regulator [Accumulibacter sp.]
MFVVTAGWETLAYSRALSGRLNGIAAVLAVSADLRELSDHRQATKWLAVMQDDGDIEAAMLLLADRRVTAAFRRGVDAEHVDIAPYLTPYKRLLERGEPIDQPVQRMTWQGIDLVMPLIRENRLLGHLYVHAPLWPLSQHLLIDLLLLTCIVLLAGGTGAQLIERKQGRLLAPLRQLAGTMRQVGHQRDFALRPRVTAPPAVAEVTGLVSAFDEMMSKLAEDDGRRAERNSQLLETNRELSVAVRHASEAQNAAEHASHAMSSLLATLSHDIRTPMTGILGMTELLLKTPLNDEQRGHAQTVINSARTLLNVFDDLVDFSNGESGELSLEATEFDLRELIEETVDRFAEGAQGKGLHLGCLLAPDTPAWVYADAQRLRQILSNLLSNAIKFTTHGEVRVDVAVDMRSGSAARLSIKVSDTGIGIDVRRQKTLFIHSADGDKQIQERRNVARIGLRLVQQLVELMGGEVGVNSAVGQGSTFWVKIPVDIQAGRPINEYPANGLRNARLLIVNANVLNRALLAQHFREWGVLCRIAVNGRVALEALHQGVANGCPFSFVVLDMLMVDLDCLALIRRLRSDPQLTDLRIMVLTAFNRPAQVAAALEAGADGCLPQPIRKKRLFHALHRVLDRTLVEEIEYQKLADGTLPGSRLRVLLVEDDVVSREVALATLAWLGCRTCAVTSGQEALQAFGQEFFHLALIDCQLPDLDGKEVVQRIRLLEKNAEHSDVLTRRMPIIAVTANVIAGHREACLQAGMDDYLAKPYDREGLLSILRRWAPPETAIPDVSPSAMGERRLIDRQVLRTLREVGNAAFVARVIALFIDAMPEKLAALDQAAKTKDNDAVARIARQIKSNGAALGLSEVVKAAAELESAARSSEAAIPVTALTALANAYSNVLPALKRLAANSDNPAALDDDPAVTAA